MQAESEGLLKWARLWFNCYHCWFCFRSHEASPPSPRAVGWKYCAHNPIKPTISIQPAHYREAGG